MIEFNLILATVNPNASSSMFWRLMIGTVLMLTCGHLGENHFLPGRPATIGFILGLSGWGYILSEIFTGEAGNVAAGADVNKYVAPSFKTMRIIVTVGWSIYPLGYFFGYLQGAVDSDALNLVYNLADFVNKIAFCLAIWACAKSSTLEKEHALIPRTSGTVAGTSSYGRV